MLRYSPCTTAWSGFVTVKHIIFLLKKVNRASLLTGWIWLLLRQVHTYSIFAICHPNANSCNTSVVQQSHVCALYLDRTSNLRYLNLLYLIIILSRWCNSTFPVVGFDVRGKKKTKTSILIISCSRSTHTGTHTCTHYWYFCWAGNHTVRVIQGHVSYFWTICKKVNAVSSEFMSIRAI